MHMLLGSPCKVVNEFPSSRKSFLVGWGLPTLGPLDDVISTGHEDGARVWTRANFLGRRRLRTRPMQIVVRQAQVRDRGGTSRRWLRRRRAPTRGHWLLADIVADSRGCGILPQQFFVFLNYAIVYSFFKWNLRCGYLSFICVLNVEC